MTIFRFSTGVLAVFLVACDDGRPPRNTYLGKIVRIQAYNDAADQLQQFAEGRINNPDELRSELLKAGFERSVFRNGPDNSTCERFDLKTKELFPSVYFVTVCSGKVFANAGQQAL